MVQTIRVDQVLRETVATPYRDLVTRATGAAVRSGIERAIRAEESLTTLLDFSRVGLVDFSCADEVVAKLLLGESLPAGRHLVLSGVREDHSEAIDHVLRHHEIAVLVADGIDGPCRILGFLAADLAQALTEILERGATDVATMAGAAAWSLEQAAEVLQHLAMLRLVQADGPTYRPVPLA
ncbi:MAG TPA: hypothetical protein VJN95_07450 [Gemmatimonadales bacterium]|nr:hypothetical protein [Gemmatimonadales bacterium]